MIADLLSPAVSDREWFADHGRRQYRFRLAHHGEVKIENAEGALDDVEGEPGLLIRRQSGFRLDCHVMEMSEISEPDRLESEDVCAAVWEELELGGIVPTQM